MSDNLFPTHLKPLVNKSYSMSRGSNVFSDRSNYLPRQSLKYTLEPVPFSLTFLFSDAQYLEFLQFYDITINHGANSFKMMLDSGTGIEEHQCHIDANSLKANKPSHNNWYVSFSCKAEATPSQKEKCTNLYDLYDCHGRSSGALLKGFESFVTGSYFE